MAWRTAGSGALSSQHLKLVRSDAKILDLYRRNRTYADVAKAGGYATASGARKAVQRALDRCVPPDRAELIRIEYHRLEALYAALRTELDDDATPARQNRLGSRILRVLDLQVELTANFTAAIPPLQRRSPARPVGVWSETLQQRVDGATLDELADCYGVSDRSAARKKLDRELADFAAGSVAAYRDEYATLLDKFQSQFWEAAVADPPDLNAVDAVCKVIARRIRGLGLAPTKPANAKGRRGHRPPPEPGPRSTVIAYWDGVDPRKGLAGIIDEPIMDEPMKTRSIVLPHCVSHEQSHQ